MSINKSFEVEVLKSGKRDDFGDRVYHYKIYSKEPESKVKEYCTNVLKEAYHKKYMPNPFVGEILKFENTTKMSGEMGNIYEYIVKKSTTA